MSWQARDWAAQVIRLAAPLLKNKARRVREAVLLNLSDRHNPKQDPYPKVATIAADIGCSERAVQRALRFWQALGVLRVVPRGRRTSLYRLHLGILPLVVPAQSSPKQSSPKQRPIVTPNAAQSSPQDGAIVTQNQVRLTKEEEPRGAHAREASAAPTAPRHPRWGERISRNWRITEDVRAFLREQGIEDPERRAEAFLHRHLAGDWRQLDWSEAFIADCLGTELRQRRAKPRTWADTIAAKYFGEGVAA